MNYGTMWEIVKVFYSSNFDNPVSYVIRPITVTELMGHGKIRFTDALGCKGSGLVQHYFATKEEAEAAIAEGVA